MLIIIMLTGCFLLFIDFIIDFQIPIFQRIRVKIIQMQMGDGIIGSVWFFVILVGSNRMKFQVLKITCSA